MDSKKVYYIDSDVIINSVRDSKNLFGKDISDPSIKLFWESVRCKFYMAISTWTLKELSKHVEPMQIMPLFEFAKKGIITLKYDEKDISAARERSKTNFDDALHIVIAEKNKVDCIVTRNVNHFEEI